MSDYSINVFLNEEDNPVRHLRTIETVEECRVKANQDNALTRGFTRNTHDFLGFVASLVFASSH